MAQVWVDHYEQTLVGIRCALAVDENSASADGALFRPFPEKALDPCRDRAYEKICGGVFVTAWRSPKRMQQKSAHST